MIRDNDIKECRIRLRAEDNISGSVFLTKQEYEIVKKTIDQRNWSNVKADGNWTGSIDIYCEEFEE